MGKTNKKKLIIAIQYIIVVFFLFFIGSGDVISPLYGDINMLDEGQFGAWLMHLQTGGHLYKDVYAAYGPLYIYPVFILAKIFSPTIFLIRVVYIVINVVLAIIINQLLLRKLKISFLLQLFCIILLLIIPGFSMRQGFGLLSLFLIYNAIESKKIIWSVTSGISLAISFLTSSDVGIFSVVISVFYLFYSAVITKEAPLFVRKTLLIVISYIFVFFIFFLWSSHEGWFYSYVTTITSDFSIYSSIAIPIGKNFPNALQLVPRTFSILTWVKYIISQQMLLYWLFFFYIITFVYFFIRIILRKFTGHDNLVLLIALFGFLLSTILVGRTDHLDFTLSPALILLTYYLSILIPTIKSRKREKNDRLVSLLLVMIIFLFSLRLISIYRPHFKNMLLIPKAIENNQTTISRLGPIAISQIQQKSLLSVQTFMKNHTKKQDKIYVFSNEPMMYFLLNKNNPTRYDLPEVANVREKRLEVLHDLMAQKPTYILYGTNSYAVDGISNYTRLPEITAYIKKNYTKEKVGDYIVYRIKK